MSRQFKQHDDLEPNDIVRYLDRPPSHAFPYRHETLEVEGQVMAYVDAGSKNAEHTVVFVHGAPESSYIWRNVMPYVERQARVIAPDHIGHGLSDKPKMTTESRPSIDFSKACSTSSSSITSSSSPRIGVR